MAGTLLLTTPGLPAAEPEGRIHAGPDADPASYKSVAARGAVNELQRRLDQGEARLEFSARHGYLPALLRELKVSPASQLLVASKTSPNKDYISPKNPRALYFNESVALAYVPGAPMLEIAAADPKLGVVFYSLEQKPNPVPRLTRDDRCLECHASAKTLNAPGWLVRSFVTHDDGDVDLLSGLMVSHRTPIAERWGGYYVTGDTGGQPHRGNFFGPARTQPKNNDVAPTVCVTDLKPFLDPAKFPESGSDVVALLVLEHQVHMMNLLTRLRLDAGALGENESFERAHPAAEAVLKYLLFVEEAPLAAPVRGSSGFAGQFEGLGPRDAQGRSLRQFDLQTRLFKNPCSFMIYSPNFDALPLRAKRHLYRRLWEVLSGEDKSADFKLLSTEARGTVREILRQTKKDLPAYWHL
ncbi:MAG TPA: hypothetical protein VNU68_07405 [Verrucomicrobiae bacterium]|nr:hypothetical protein [Verrucomicrobiae bacterium]